MDLDSDFCKIDTAHNSLELRRRNGFLELRSIDGAMQSLIDLNKPHRLGLKNLEFLVAVLLFITPPRRILLLGTAAGSLLHFLRHHYEVDLVAVDRDTELIETMLGLDILPAADDKLSYVHDDALHFIEHCQDRFDLVLIDIFDGAQSPRWLLENKALEQIARLVNPFGAMAFNLLIDSNHDFTQFYRNLRLVCQRQTLCTSVEGFENTIVFGFRDQLPQRELSWYLEHSLDLSREHAIDYMQILSAIYTTNPDGAI